MEHQQKDNILWQHAKKRTDFKWSLTVYILVNTFLVAVWYFTSGSNSYFWPIWPILGWGIGIAVQYLNAFYGNKIFSPEEEYEKLKNKIK